MLTKKNAVFKSKSKHHHKNHNKFKIAFNGIIITFKEENSFRYQFYLFLLTLLFGFIFNISLYEWLIIIFISIVVFTIEMLNTSIENIIDLVSPDYNEKAGKIKDISAGAVFVSSIGAFIIGLVIFIPKFINIII